MIENLHRHTGHSEIQSWMNSMQYMYKVMEYSAIPDNSEIAIEYQIPNSNKRVDFIISGQNDEGRESAIIVELKQWQKGTNENTNGLLREFYPKGMDFSEVEEHELEYNLKSMNNRPRKCLNYNTPNKIINSHEMLHLI